MGGKQIYYSLTSVPKYPITQLVHVSAGSTLKINLDPVTKGDITVFWNGKTHTLDNSNSISIVAPNQAGKYFLTSPATPISLEIYVLSVPDLSKEMASENPAAPQAPTSNVFQKVVNWVGGWWN